MACFWLNRNNTELLVPSSEEINGITYYLINIKVGDVEWKVKHRYNDFYELHQQLVSDHGVSKDILPPKKVIYNKCPTFIDTRRQGLEGYLKNVFNYLQRTMPRVFLQFLDFHLYDIFFLLQNMALEFYREGDQVLQTTKMYMFNILELHAISECFKKPFQVEEEMEKRYDLSHVLDLCSQLSHLKIVSVPTPYRNSSIAPNELPFELSCFRSLQTMEVMGVSLRNLYSVGNVRNVLKTLKVYNGDVTHVSQVLMCDTVHHTNTTNNEVWHNVTQLDLSFNEISMIDTTIQLVPNIEMLILTQNQISEIDNLSSLSKLSHLILSNNAICNCDNLHTKLGNIVHLDLSQNTISSLKGFEKLYSLESLDVSCNQIISTEEIKHIGRLPCLEHLRLTGNPVAITVDYRVKVLEHFGSRAAHIYLDNEKPTQKETDTAYILQALRIVKEGKTPNLNNIDNYQPLI